MHLRTSLRAASLAAITAGFLAAGPAQAAEISEIHFLIPGGAGGGWDGTARGVGEALTGAGLIDSASFENMSGGGGGKAIAHIIEIADRADGVLKVNSTPIILRSLRGTFPQSFRDLTPIAAVIGDYAAFGVRPDSDWRSFEDAAAAYRADPRSVRVAGGSVRGGMDHLVTSLAFQAYGADDPNSVRYIPYDAGGDAVASVLSGETQIVSSGLSEMLEQQRNGQLRILCSTAQEEVQGVPPCGNGIDFVNWRGFFAAPGMDADLADAYAALLGEMYETEAWETVRARNGWVEIYKPRAEFTAFLEGQEQAMKDLLNKLGIETVR